MKLNPILTDASVKREQIRSSVVDSLRDVFPVQGRNFDVDVRDVKVHEADYSTADHKRALLQARTLAEPVRGTLLLKDKKGKVVQKVPNFNLVQLPYFTPHHTFVIGGNSYTVSNQLRMKPGIYTRKRRNEDLEAQFNLGKGDNFRLSMDPSKGVFNIEYGTTKIPLYSVLRQLGVPDKDIIKNWDKGITALNRKAVGSNDGKYIEKLYNRIIRPYQRTAETMVERVDAIKEAYNETRLDPKITQKTLNKKFDRVTPAALLAASNKLLRAHREDVDFDERDSLEFKRMLGVEDFLGERVKLEARNMKRKLVDRLDRAGIDPDLEKMITRSPFSKTMNQFLSTSSLANNPDQINPVEILDQAVRVTSLGEGGIEDERAIPREARNLHATHMGILDPVRTPESSRAGIDLRTTIFALRDKEGNVYTQMRGKDGRVRAVPVDVFSNSTVAFPQQALKGKVDVLRNYQVESVPASQVDYQVPNPQALYSPSTNLIPFIESTDGLRATMGAKMNTQALPLNNPEAPLVQVKSHLGDESMESVIGDMIAVRAPVSGNVSTIRDGYIYIRPKEKTAAEGESVRIRYEENFPLASKTYLHHELNVKKGDKVKAGELLADSIFTKDGVLALGKNLRTAYMPVHGLNSNDAVVVSESAAGKLTSKHMYREALDADQDMSVGRNVHRTYFGGQYTKSAYEKLDSEGLIKPGTIVKPGDLLVAAVRKSSVSPESAMLGKLHKSLIKPYRDAGLTWEHSSPGEVIDVARVGNKIRLTVKTEEQLQVGDKLCFTEDTEVLTKDGWKPVAEITVNDVCYTLNPETKRIELHEPDSTHSYPTAGALYELESQQVDLRVTTNHKLYVQQRTDLEYGLVSAEEVIGKRVRHTKTAEWHSETPEMFEIPILEATATGKGAHKSAAAAHRFSHVPTRHWLRFLGAYLANGSTTKHDRKDRPGSTEYRATLHTIRGITHSVSGNQHTWLKSILDECQFPYTECEDRLIIHSKQLACVLAGFGHARDKHVPEYVFSWGKDAAEWILEGLLGCDGHKTHSGSLGYTTVSARLADNVQRLALHVGWAANISYTDPRNPNWSRRYLVKIIRSRCFPQINHGHSKTQNGQTERITQSDEPVYGVTVPNGILYVRINGKPVFTGNSGRYGNKGVVSKIIPDDQMIQDEKGRPIDLIVSSASVVSRINPSQVLETALAKVAEKTGKPVVVESFSGRNNVQWVKDELKKNGLKDTETVTDPTTGKEIKGVLVGPQYTYKLFKSTETNFAARGVEDYDSNLQPSQGGAKGAKGLGRMEVNALIAHDARNILRDAASLKSQRNDEFWRAVQLGLPLPPVKTTFAYDKFGAMLSGAGVKMDKRDNQVTLGPLTDEEVAAVSAGPISNPLFVRAKDLRPERGGLFDPTATGGSTGGKWAHINLNEPIVNPTFERPARTLLGMTQKEFKNTIRTEGGRGIKKRLSEIDPRKREKEVLALLKKTKGTSRDNSIKELKYLRALSKAKLSPDKAYVISKVPVVPPQYRPIVPGKSGDLQVSDANWLYRDVMLANDLLRKSKNLPPEVQSEARQHLYDATSALYGLRDPVSPQVQQRGAKGFIARIAGTQPKTGFFHSKLVRKTQDVSARGTIVPDTTMGIDEIGIPEEMAWESYSPFIIKRLVTKRGYKALEARQMVKDRHPIAKQVMTEELRERPIIVNRAPSLRRYNVLSAYPRAVPGKSIRIHELLAPVMAGDFDGDAVQMHVPVSDPAVEEAKGLTLSNMLLGDQWREQLLVAPDQEAVLGLYQASIAKPTGKKKTFKSREDAMAAYNRGEITLGTPVEIKK